MLVTVPEKMLYVQILTDRSVADDLVKELQRLELFQPESMREVSEEELEWLRNQLNIVERVERLVNEYESALSKPLLVRLGPIEIDVDRLEEVSAKLLKTLEEGVPEILRIRKRIDELRDELSSKKEVLEILGYLYTYGGMGGEPLSNISFKGELVKASTIVMERDVYLKMGGVRGGDGVILRIIEPEDSRHVVIIAAGQRESVDKVLEELRRAGGKEVDIPSHKLTIGDYILKLSDEVRGIEGRISRLTEEFWDRVRKLSRDVALAKLVVKALRERLNALEEALKGRYLIVLEGWVPASSINALRKGLESRVKHLFIREVKTDREPPTKMRNPRIFRVYEMITRIYGVPNHREFDPTPIITYSLTIFFGLMFADVVYGSIMLFIVNYLLEKTGFIDNPYSEGYRMFKKLFTCLACSSIFFGFLSNSFAGYSIVFRNGGIAFEAVTGPKQPALLPLLNPMFFIALALLIGLTHVNIAHALAFVKALKQRDRGEILSKAGFFIAEFFGIPYVLNRFMHTPLPPPFNLMGNYLLYGAIAGMAALTTGKFITYKGLGSIFWLFDITGLLGDAMSYTRLAGIGLATSLLAQNFNSLAIGLGRGIAGMAHLTGLIGLVLGGFASLLVMIFANLLNIAFGIIGAFVHSLRLCFVEFLPKFYDGDGREFKPLRLKAEEAVVLGGSTVSF